MFGQVSPRIGVVVTDAYGPQDPDHDTPLLLPALRARGLDADPVVWHDPASDWSGYDLLVLRSPWDYPARLPEFLAWLALPAVATRLLNPADLVAWNLDKRYLGQLAAAGIAVVPTRYATREQEVRGALAAAIGRVVIKPACSAGSRHTGLFDHDDDAALALARTILAEGGAVMVQPEVPELSGGAERALYFIDGEFTHAIGKGALLAPGGGLISGQYQEHPELVTVCAHQLAFAERVLDAVRDVTGCAMPLYARVDIVDSAQHGPLLLEIELAEPALNLHLVPEAVVDAAAQAILARVPR